MCISGIGTWPKNAFRASQSSTVLSFPIDQSIPRCLKLAYASRRMCTLRFSSWSRWSISSAIRSASNRVQHLGHALIHAQGAGIERQLRVLRRLIRVVDPGKVLDLTTPGAGVQSLDVTPLALVQGVAT